MIKEAEKLHADFMQQVSQEVAVKPEAEAIKKKKKVIITSGDD